MVPSENFMDDLSTAAASVPIAGPIAVLKVLDISVDGFQKRTIKHMCLIFLPVFCFTLKNYLIQMFYRVIWWLIKINRKYNWANCFLCVQFRFFHIICQFFMICLGPLHIPLRKLNGFVICQLRPIVIHTECNLKKIIDDFRIAICVTHKEKCVVVYLCINKHLTSLKYDLPRLHWNCSFRQCEWMKFSLKSSWFHFNCFDVKGETHLSYSSVDRIPV